MEKVLLDVKGLGNILQRAELHQKAVKLHIEGLGYRKIAKMLGVSKNTVNSWIYGGHNPINRLKNIPKIEPCEELAYLCGVMMGDGYLKRKNYRIGLKARDKDFVEAFQGVLFQIFGREYKIQREDKYFYVQAKSKYFFLWLSNRKNLEKLGELYPKEFIRGFADSEGCVSLYQEKSGRTRRAIELYNTDISTLNFIAPISRRFLGINFRLRHHKIGKKDKHVTHVLYIKDRRNLAIFSEFINFSIARKRRCLEKVLTSYKGIRKDGTVIVRRTGF